jgi:hypothetical protein
MDKTFTCDECGGTFRKAWTDKEAAEERRENFPDHDGAWAIVCDDCYSAIMVQINDTA